MSQNTHLRVSRTRPSERSNSSDGIPSLPLKLWTLESLFINNPCGHGPQLKVDLFDTVQTRGLKNFVAQSTVRLESFVNYLASSLNILLSS